MTVDGAAGGAGVRTFLGGFKRYQYPFVALVRRDLKKRYARTMLGFAWGVMQPLAMFAIYYFVFGFVLRTGRASAGPREYAVFMLAGMLPYFALSEGLHRSIGSLREDRALLDRSDFPAEVVPAARVVSASFPECGGLLLLIILHPFLGMPTGPALLLLPLLVSLRILMTCGVAWVLATLALFVADLAEAISFALTALLFLTPIFYAPSAVPSSARWVQWINPLHHVVEAYRGVLVTGEAHLDHLLFMTVTAALFATLGLAFFRWTLDRGKDFL